MLTVFETATIGLVFGLTAPIGLAVWSYLFYKLVLKSLKYNLSKFLQKVKREVLS